MRVKWSVKTHIRARDTSFTECGRRWRTADRLGISATATTTRPHNHDNDCCLSCLRRRQARITKGFNSE